MHARALLSLLLTKGLITEDAVLDGPMTVVDASRRNRNLLIATGGGGLFVKGARDEERHRTIAHEAAFYAFAADAPCLAGCRQHVPSMSAYLEDEGLLVLERVDEAISVRQHFLALGRSTPGPSRLIAGFLARLHAATSGVDAARFDAARSPRAPFGLSFDAPDQAILHSASGAGLQLVRIVQSSETIVAGLRMMRDGWQPHCLIHGDMRWDNCLLTGAGRGRALHVVDWELACHGDPAWDLAAIFAEHLGLWLQSAPLGAIESDARNLALARFPLAPLQQSAAAFWSTYAEARALAPAALTAIRRRAVGFTAARLIQSGFEWTSQSATVPGHAILAVQMAENILLEPHAAAVELFGLPAEAEEGE